MAEDERLREALLELQMLRDREAQVLEETKTLLDCLEAYSTAQSPNAALASIFMSLRQKIGSVASLILERDETGGAMIVAADGAALIGTKLVSPVDLFDRPRNVGPFAFGGLGRHLRRQNTGRAYHRPYR